MSTQRNRSFMQLAYEQALMAERAGEAPIGAVLVRDEAPVSHGHNMTICNHDASAHAEIVALRSGGQILLNHRLVECELFVTLEPCAMCLGAIMQARLAGVIFAAGDPQRGALGGALNLHESGLFNHKLEITSGVLGEQCGALLRKFFQSRRQKRRP